MQPTLRQHSTIPRDLEGTLAGLSEADLDLARGEGAWTIREIVHHIVDSYDTTWHAIAAAIGKPGCRYYLDWYDPANTWTQVMKYSERPIGPALALLRAKCDYVAHILEVVPDAGGRWLTLIRVTGEPERKLNVTELLQHLSQHAYQHIDQIRFTRDKHGK